MPSVPIPQLGLPLRSLPSVCLLLKLAQPSLLRQSLLSRRQLLLLSHGLLLSPSLSSSSGYSAWRTGKRICLLMLMLMLLLMLVSLRCLYLLCRLTEPG
jgi:hypothetical protein